MPYKPTGRPPGRPPGAKNKPKPEVSGQESKAPEKPALPKTPPRDFDASVGLHGPLAGHICPFCYPDGWPEGWTGVGCKHGIWTRRP